MSGILMILSGPSGVGKDTVIQAWKARNPRVERVVTCTTRSPRPGERHGVDYWFLSDSEFQDRARAGKFLEHMQVHGHGYATPLDQICSWLAEGKIVVLKIDVQGAEAVRRVRGDTWSVFLMPPSMEALEQRIRDRRTEDEAAIERRLANARREVEQAAAYDHVIVNDDVGRVVEQLESIVPSREECQA